MPLRDYQQETNDAVYDWMYRNMGNPIVAACVGAGKSHMIAAICQHSISQWPETRILMTVASQELCAQNLSKLFDAWPDAPASLCAAGLGSRDIDGQIIYSTVASIYKRAHELGHVSIIMIDECHLVTDTGMYAQLITELKKYNPKLRVIGWTGTDFRGDGIWLTHQKDPMFHGVAARITMRRLLDLGYLSPLKTATTQTFIDTAGARKTKYDYNVSDLAANANRIELIQAAVAEILDLTRERKRCLIYAVTIDHAVNVGMELTRRKVMNAVVHSKQPNGMRKSLIQDFRKGRIKYLVNVAVLTTGFDVPELDAIALLRATASPVLYTQIAGRGMRIAPGKEDCLWLDFTSTTELLGPVDTVRGRKPSPRKGMPVGPVTKTCDNCNIELPGGTIKCPACGHLNEIDRVNHGRTVSDAAVLSAKDGERHVVTKVTYQQHKKPGGLTSMRVAYFSGMHLIANEFICFEHSGYPRQQAESWWSRRCKYKPPDTVSMALNMASHFAEPLALFTVRRGKYREIIKMEWQAHDY